MVLIRKIISLKLKTTYHNDYLEKKQSAIIF
jgi:hypothetical protein